MIFFVKNIRFRREKKRVILRTVKKINFRLLISREPFEIS